MGQGYTGQRSRRTEHVLTKDAEGRYRNVPEPEASRHVQLFLPHYQVCVCEPCNSGWMSDLEDQVKPILDPMIRGHHVELGDNEQTKLATLGEQMYVCLRVRGTGRESAVDRG